MKYLIYAGWLNPNQLIGYLFIDKENGNTISSFEYDQEWLKNNSIVLDPEIELYPGRQYSDKGLFGFLKDISPDRWGRTLLDRAEIQIAIFRVLKPNLKNFLHHTLKNYCLQ